MAAATTRRLLCASSLLHPHRYTPSYSSLSKPHHRNLSFSNHFPLDFTKPTFFPSLSPSLKPHIFHKYTTSSASSIGTLTEDTTTHSTPYVHPWPEWVTLLEKLKSKGFLDDTKKTTFVSVEGNDDNVGGGSDNGGDEGQVAGNTKNDLNLLRNALLSFARERYDIFKSLSREHIQTVVECGCPSLFRKAVSSAKRLRAHIGLDEGDVCNACNLKGSCDRSYQILKDSEGSARTVDIVRVLLIYALDPLVLSGGERPRARGLVEASARKLLAEMSELSETRRDPALPMPGPVKPPKPVGEKINTREASQNVEMKRGDWICSKCNFMNFSRNLRCLDCKAEGPKRVSVDDVEMKKGDWTCDKCKFMNFARNTECMRCKASRPKRVLLPGEWECPSCDFLNYRRNKICLKCNCDRPQDVVAEYEEQIWRKPR